MDIMPGGGIVRVSSPGSAARSLAAALGVASAGGLVTGTILAVAVAKLNGWGLGRDAAILAAYLSALYGCVFLVGLGSVALGSSMLGRHPGPREFTGVLLAFSVFLTAVLRFSPAIQLASVVPSMNLIGVVDLLVVAVASIAVAAAVIRSDAKVRVAAAGIAIFGLAALQAVHIWHERPLYRDVEALVSALPSDGAPSATTDVARFEEARVIVLGLDGLTWENLLPLMKRGELPHFRALLHGAAYGYLETLPFAVSPVVWETVNTGRSPDQHGIGYHMHFSFPGLDHRVARLPGLRLCNTPMGLRHLLAATQGVAPWSGVPATGLDSRAARVWEIASDHDVRVGVYNWFNLGPVPPVRGFLRSNGQIQPAHYPEDLEQGYPPLPPRPNLDPRTRPAGEVAEPERERSNWQRFVDHTLKYRPQLLMYYTHYSDGVNHLNWKYEHVGPSLFYRGWRHPDFEPGPMTSAAHRFLDTIVGDILRRMPEDAVVVVLSDHGFDFRGYEHDNSPAGVLIMRGPGIEPGLVEGASVYDVAPTLLHLLGLPAALDMAGTVMTPVRGERAERIASYGAAAPIEGSVRVDAEEEARQRDYLKSLGYVVD